MGSDRYALLGHLGYIGPQISYLPLKALDQTVKFGEMLYHIQYYMEKFISPSFNEETVKTPAAVKTCN